MQRGVYGMAACMHCDSCMQRSQHAHAPCEPPCKHPLTVVTPPRRPPRYYGCGSPFPQGIEGKRILDLVRACMGR